MTHAPIDGRFWCLQQGSHRWLPDHHHQAPCCLHEGHTDPGRTPSAGTPPVTTATEPRTDRTIIGPCQHCGNDTILIHHGAVPEPWHEAEAAPPTHAQEVELVLGTWRDYQQDPRSLTPHAQAMEQLRERFPEGAAPRVEGLDAALELMREVVEQDYEWAPPRPDGGRESVLERASDFLEQHGYPVSRPSDERVPESEEPR